MRRVGSDSDVAVLVRGDEDLLRRALSSDETVAGLMRTLGECEVPGACVWFLRAAAFADCRDRSSRAALVDGMDRCSDDDGATAPLEPPKQPPVKHEKIFETEDIN